MQALMHEKVGKGVKEWELKKLPRSESHLRLRGLGLNEYEVQRAQWALDQPLRWPVAKLFKKAASHRALSFAFSFVRLQGSVRVAETWWLKAQNTTRPSLYPPPPPIA